MSWWWYVEDVPCPCCGKGARTLDDINVTYNVGRILRAVCLDPWERRGERFGDLLPQIRRAIEDIEDNMEWYRHLEPGNGWGTVESVLKDLHWLKRNALENPDCIWRVS